MTDEENLSPNPVEDRTVRHSLTITSTLTPGDLDEEGNQKPPKMDVVPSGPGIQPDDCIALALHGAQWALRAHVATKERISALMKQQQEKSRVIVLGREGRA